MLWRLRRQSKHPLPEDKHKSLSFIALCNEARNLKIFLIFLPDNSEINTKMFNQKSQFLIVSLMLLTLHFSCTSPKKIVCVGDSITEGYGLKNPSKSAYPAMLDSILGEEYSVYNCGRSAATLQTGGDLPYWDCKEFNEVFALNPDLIIVMLGTNDTKSHNWNAQNFASDYQALIDTFNTVSPKPNIFVCLPVPVFKTTWGINDSTISAGVIPITKQIATHNNLKIVDLHTGLSNQATNFPDYVHPNEKAAKLLAEQVARAIEKEQ